MQCSANSSCTHALVCVCVYLEVVVAMTAKICSVCAPTSLVCWYPLPVFAFLGLGSAIGVLVWRDWAREARCKQAAGNE